MELTPKISVIIPIYNCEKYLERCFDSICAQTFSDFEAIMVDDGSSDGSAEIAKAYAAKDARFKYYYKENGGVSSARNYALDIAAGEYIGFVDADDEILPDMLLTLITMINDTGAEASVISPIIRIDGKDVPYTDTDALALYDAPSAINEALCGRAFAGHLCTKLFSRVLFDGIRLREDFAICEDLVMVYELFLRCEKIAFRARHLYVYYTNSQSAINSSFKESFLTYIDATEYLLARVKSELPSAITYAKCACLNAYLDVINKLYYAGRYKGEVRRKYKSQLSAAYDKDALALMPLYKRIIIRSMRGPHIFYAITVRSFNLMKKIIYFFTNK